MIYAITEIFNKLEKVNINKEDLTLDEIDEEIGSVLIDLEYIIDDLKSLSGQLENIEQLITDAHSEI